MGGVMRRAVEIVLAVLGCAILGLIISLVLAGIGQSGVISMHITRALFWLAFVISLTAASLATWLFSQSVRRSVMAFIGTVIVVGGGLWLLAGWLQTQKDVQDATDKPPAIPDRVVASLPPPTFAMHKTPKKKAIPVVPDKSAGSNSPNSSIGNLNQQGQNNTVQQGNNNTAGPTVNCPSVGVCAGHDVNGPTTVTNYGAVDRHLSQATANALDGIAQSVPETYKKLFGVLVVEDGEAETFADEIATVFGKYGIGGGHALGGEHWSPQTPKGVVVIVKAKDDPAAPLAEQIANAMNSTGVSAVGIMFSPKMASGMVHIIVGDKTDGPTVGGVPGAVIAR